MDSPLSVSAPAALRARFALAWARLGAAGDSTRECDLLWAAWNEPTRHYHDGLHLQECLAGLDAHSHLAPRPALLEMVLWYHDAVYDSRAPDNEERSACWAEASLGVAGVDATVVAEVGVLIRLTKTHGPVVSPEAALLCDLDLAILGREPSRYDGYEAAIRREYAWVPWEVYQVKRAEVLRSFLNRANIFHTPPFQATHESQARSNLRRALAALGR